MLTLVQQVKDYLVGISEIVPPGHDELITFIIRRQSAAAEQFCRRKFGKATYTAELHTGQSGQVEFFPHQWPIVTVTTVTIDGTAVVAGTDSDDYLLLKNTDGETWALYRKDGWKSDPHKLLITYDAGYVLPAEPPPTSPPRNLPYDLEGAVTELTAGMYLARGKAGLTRESFEGLSVDFDRWPSHIVQALSKYQRPRI